MFVIFLIFVPIVLYFLIGFITATVMHVWGDREIEFNDLPVQDNFIIHLTFWWVSIPTYITIKYLIPYLEEIRNRK